MSYILNSNSISANNIEVNGTALTSLPYTLKNGDKIVVTYTLDGSVITVNGVKQTSNYQTFNLKDIDIVVEAVDGNLEFPSITINYTQTATGTNKLKFGTETPTKLYMGDTEVTKAYMGDTLVYEKSESSGETWLLNESLIDTTSEMGFNVSIGFTSNNETFTSISLLLRAGREGVQLEYGSTTSYNSIIGSGWTNQAYRTINFAKPPTGDLLTWLQANGVKQ